MRTRSGMGGTGVGRRRVVLVAAAAALLALPYGFIGREPVELPSDRLAASAGELVRLPDGLTHVEAARSTMRGTSRTTSVPMS